jgi:uncharacterized protein (TIGR02646 family)
VIKVGRPPNVAGDLAGGQALVADLTQQRALDPTAGASRARAFTFDRSLYGAAGVKRALKKAQHGKCCYCEGRITAHSPGDVEHFRPKTAVQQRRGLRLDYPGYYWLAYRWENLLFACDICNRSKKRSLFPLRDPALRCTNPTHPPGQEDALLVHPADDEPRDHIRFGLAVPIGQTDEGRMTIDVLGLKRGELKRERVSRLKRTRALLDLAKLAAKHDDQPELMKAMRKLKQLTLPKAPFSSMVIDYLERHSIRF